MKATPEQEAWTNGLDAGRAFAQTALEQPTGNSAARLFRTAVGETAAVARTPKDPAQRRAWLAGLSLGIEEELGAAVPPLAVFNLASQLTKGGWGSDEIGIVANWLAAQGFDVGDGDGATDEPVSFDIAAAGTLHAGQVTSRD